MMKKIKLAIVGLLGVLSYIIIFFILRMGFKYIPDFSLWGDYRTILNIYSLSFSFIDIIYFLFGMVVTIHGAINLFLITKENHQAQNMETRKPAQLITTGFYSKVRHPMYGTFIINCLGLFISTRSLWGIMIIILVFIIQVISTNYEEKNELIKIFGDEYKKYKENVSNRFFLFSYKVYISISVIMSLGGLVFRFSNVV